MFAASTLNDLSHSPYIFNLLLWVCHTFFFLQCSCLITTLAYLCERCWKSQQPVNLLEQDIRCFYFVLPNGYANSHLPKHIFRFYFFYIVTHTIFWLFGNSGKGFEVLSHGHFDVMQSTAHKLLIVFVSARIMFKLHLFHFLFKSFYYLLLNYGLL